MRSRMLLCSVLTATIFLLAGSALVFSQPRPTAASIRSQAETLRQQGNFQEGLTKYRQLLSEPRFANDAKPSDVSGAFECLQRLNKYSEADAVLESAADNNARSWRVLQEIAQKYRQLPHQGTIVAGEYQRGVYGRQGRRVTSVERDFTRSLQLYEQARQIVEREASQRDAGQFYLDLARAILSQRSGGASWQLQALTDLSTLPDFQEGYGAGSYSAAPVDEDGNPIFHYPSATWEAAKSDGQRWRFALQRAADLDRNLREQVTWERCRFLETQFSVTTLAHYSWFHRMSQDADAAKGVLSLRTLSDEETVCRLASGVKRFKLPESHNYIAMYKSLASGNRGYNSSASERLAGIYTDRMQFPKAAEQWRETIERFGSNAHRQRMLDQIVGNWGKFEPTMAQAAGKGARFQFRFRNGDRVFFTAKRVKIDALLNDMKAYLRTEPEQIDWQQIQFSNLGYRLAMENQDKYIGEEVARWSLDLEPRANHFDKRIEVATSLQRGGAYLITAKMRDGNSNSIVAWITDTAIVQKRIDNNSMYLFAEAGSGKPIGNVEAEFFGYASFYRRVGRKNIRETKTKAFQATSDANGQLIPTKLQGDDQRRYQWVVTAKTADGRPAYFGFHNIWSGQRYDRPFDFTKAFCITDRPVYRPQDTVHLKAWIKRTSYDSPDDRSEYAGRSVTLQVHNPKGERILEVGAKVDAYGGATADYKLPKDAELGRYRVSVAGVSSSGQFRVEEYKKPEFEVKVEAPEKPILLGEKFTAKVKANYYYGAPVREATVKLKVTRDEFQSDWYPYHPWDWYYGPGFWWFVGDYDWCPRSQSWLGCVRPPFGPVFNRTPPEVVLEMEQPIGAEGEVDVEIDSAIAQLIHGDSDHRYTITAEVRDASRRTIVGQGSVIAARKPFMVYTWLERGYYEVGDQVTASFKAKTLDDRAIEDAPVQIQLLRLTYDDEGQPIEQPVQQFEARTGSDGEGTFQLQAARAGQYRLSVKVNHPEFPPQEGGYIFTIRGRGDDGSGYRFDTIEIIPEKKTYRVGEKVRLKINTDRAGSTVYLFTRPVNSVYYPPQVIRMQGKSTVVEIPVQKADMPNFFVEAMTIQDGQVHTVARSIAVPPEKRILNVEVLPNEEDYRPREAATIKLHLTDHEGENYVGTTAVAVYDRALEYIAGTSNEGDIRSYFWKWIRSHQPFQATNLDAYSTYLNDGKPQLQPLGAFGNQAADMEMNDKLQKQMPRRQAGRALGAAPAGAMVAESAVMGDSGGMRARSDGDAQAAELVEPTVRSNFADTALWVAAVETDQNGVAEVKLEMPENLTSWKVQVWGVGHGGRVGSGNAEVTTSKNVIVRLQAPRFFTEKDEAVLSAVVHNYLNEAKATQISIEIEGPIELLQEQTRDVTIDADGEARVDWRVRVTGEGDAKIRMFAKTDEESDAMEMTFPCQIFGAERVQSYVASLRPDEQRESITFTVPLERRPEQSRLEVRYSPSLAGAMVDALPYLAEYPYGCTEQTLNRFLPAVITQRTLQRMNLDLEAIKKARSNLNAQEIGDDRERAKQWKRFEDNPVFDVELLQDMVREGVRQLTIMQNADGGWGWFSGRYERSTAHTTVVVLRGLRIAQQNDVEVDPAVIQRGVDWLRNYQKQELQKLKNHERDVDPRKAHADNVDALVYQTLVAADVDNREMRDWIYRDRNHLSVYAKTVFGLAMHQVEDEPKLQMLLRNIRQFRVDDDENETSYLDLGDGGWWYWHGDPIEANAFYLKLLTKTDPDGETAPRLVKYLLNNRKHATYWKSTRDTALCVEAFADYLQVSEELNPEMTVEVWLDGEKQKEVAISRDNLFTYDNRFVLEGAALEGGEHQLEIRRSGKGAVYFNAYVTNFSLEDHIPPAGLEVKVERKYYRLTPREKKGRVPGDRGQVVTQDEEAYDRTPLTDLRSLKSGDLVEVELKLISKNDYEYLLFEDMKAAGLEPVDLRSGYLRHSGPFQIYREFRDNRVGFFLRTLPRGEHSLSYRLRAETPGRFAALPAQAYAMYAPELRGNSADDRVEIVDPE